MSYSLWPHGLLHQASLTFTISFSLLKFMSIGLVMLSNHLILWVNILSQHRGPMSQLFTLGGQSFSTSPSNEYSGLISFRIDWFDLFAVQETLKSLLQHHSSKASLLQASAFSVVQLSHLYMTTGKTIALTIGIFVGKVMSLLFNMLSKFVIAFLPSSKHLLMSWLQSPSTVILELKKIKSVTSFTFPPSTSHEVMRQYAMILVFWMLSLKPAFFTLLFHSHQETL